MVCCGLECTSCWLGCAAGQHPSGSFGLRRGRLVPRFIGAARSLCTLLSARPLPSPIAFSEVSLINVAWGVLADFYESESAC